MNRSYSIGVVVAFFVIVTCSTPVLAEEARGQERVVLADLDNPVEYGSETVSLGMGSEWGVRHSPFATGVFATIGAPIARELRFRPFGELYWTMSYAFSGSWLLGAQFGIGARYDGSGPDAYFAQWVYFMTLRPLGPHISVYMMESPEFLGHENRGELYFRLRVGLKIDLPQRPDIFFVPAVQVAWIDMVHDPRNPGGGIGLSLFKAF